MTQVLENEVKKSEKYLTFEEYRFYQSNDDILYELFRGQLIAMPTPTALHANICNYLVYQLREHFAEQNINLIATTTVGVRTEENSSRIPDVVVGSENLWAEIVKRKGAGVFDLGETPALVIEVTSTNWRDDYIRKRAEYDLIDIPEYWIINPEKKVIFVLSKPDNEHEYKSREFKPGEQMISVQFHDLILSVDTVLSPPLVENLVRLEKIEKNQLKVEKTQLENELELEREKRDRLQAKLKELGIDPDAI
ncbi:MAG TPA: Uma2 family endonuclease [Allocoleopsis sp.]